MARNTDGPLANEFARVLQEMQIGLGRSNALRALGERSNLPDLRSFCSAMVQADAFGIPVGQVLRVQSSEMRVKRRQKAEEAAQKIPVKIMIPLVLLHPALAVRRRHRPRRHRDDGRLRRRRSAELSQREQVAITSRVFCLAAILGLSVVAGDATTIQTVIAVCVIGAMSAYVSYATGRTTLLVPDRRDRPGRPGRWR